MIISRKKPTKFFISTNGLPDSFKANISLICISGSYYRPKILINQSKYLWKEPKITLDKSNLLLSMISFKCAVQPWNKAVNI